MSKNREARRIKLREIERLNADTTKYLLAVIEDQTIQGQFYSTQAFAIEQKMKLYKMRRRLFWKRLFGLVPCGNLPELYEKK